MEVEEFTKRTKKWKRKWKRDRSLDAGEKHGLWGIGDRGRTCPVPSPANGRFTGSHLLLGPAVPAPTACLHPWWYQGTGLFAAVLGEPKGRHSPEHSLSFPSSLELGKILPSQEKLGKLDKILFLGLPHPPPSPLQRILTTCMSDVRAIPPPVVDGMPCFRSMIRAASWGMRHHDPLQPGPASEFSLILSSTHTLDRELSPSSRGRARTADCRLLDMQSAFASCSRRAPAPQRSPCPKGHILRSDAMITTRAPREDETARSTQARLKPRLATVASRQHVSTILSLALNSWVHQHDVAPEPTFSSLNVEANAQVALWAVLTKGTSRGCWLTVSQDSKLEDDPSNSCGYSEMLQFQLQHSKPFRGPWGL